MTDLIKKPPNANAITAAQRTLPPGVSYPYGERGEVYLPEERRNEGLRSKNGRKILAKELYMARIFAKAGHKIVFTEDGADNHDVFIDDIPADLKRLSKHINIIKNAKHAVNKQNAQLVLFEFTRETQEIHNKIEELKRKGYRGKYFFSGNDSVHDF